MTCYISLQSIFEQNSNLDKKSFNFESATCQRSKISLCNIPKNKKSKKVYIMPFLVYFTLGIDINVVLLCFIVKKHTDASK